jgi:DNA-binding NtrC family response regulator
MKKVLVVDDTQNIRMLLTECLEIEGYKVESAGDGVSALKLLKGNKYDLVFLDIKLPEMSGTEVLRDMRAAGIDIPVIIMTAFATVKNAIECTRMGAVYYLQKPFTSNKVRSVLKDLNEADEFEIMAKEIETAGKLSEEGKFEEAYNILKRCLAKDPESPEIFYAIGELFEKQGNKAKALKFHGISRILSEKTERETDC